MGLSPRSVAPSIPPRPAHADPGNSAACDGPRGRNLNTFLHRAPLPPWPRPRGGLAVRGRSHPPPRAAGHPLARPPAHPPEIPPAPHIPRRRGHGRRPAAAAAALRSSHRARTEGAQHASTSELHVPPPLRAAADLAGAPTRARRHRSRPRASLEGRRARRVGRRLPPLTGQSAPRPPPRAVAGATSPLHYLPAAAPRPPARRRVRRAHALRAARKCALDFYRVVRRVDWD